MHESQLDAAVAAAKAGGYVLIQQFRKLDMSKVSEKSKHDHVSQADRDSETAIREELDYRFPQYSFIGEETGSSGDSSRRWIVDPLDGTLNFIQGFPHWCVSVALWDGDGPVVACIYDPLRQDVFTASRNQGAFWNGERMTISQQHSLDGAFLATGFAFQLGERFPKWLKALQNVFPHAKGIRRAGSAALDLAHTACGIYDGYFEMGLKAWDIAAGVLLVQEAGGVVSDWDGGHTWFETGNLVAGNLWVQQGLLDALMQG